MRRALTVLLLLAGPAYPSGTDCVVSGTIPSGSVFIGYTRASEATLRAFALFDGASLGPYDGHGLAAGQTLHGLLGPTRATIEEIEPYLDRRGENHCVYPATLSISPTRSWEIWASRPNPRVRLRLPSPDEKKQLLEYEPACIFQGGPPPEGVEPTCMRAELVAISDLDGDAKLEYWHTVPYAWDTGFRVAEEQAGGLVSMLSACPGCSD